MIRLGITGFPLVYTKSPGLHRGFLRAKKRSGSYAVLPFDPSNGRAAFYRFLDEKRSEGYRGLNVTIPLKEWAYDYALRRGGVIRGFEGECAREVRAANTLIFGRHGEVRAANTDSVGLWDDISGWLSRLGRGDGGLELLVVGTGGAARGALAGVLAGHPASRSVRSIRIWGRDPSKARQLQKLVPASLRGKRELARGSGLLLVLWCLPPVRAADARAIFKDCVGDRALRRPSNIALYDLNYSDRADPTQGLVPPRYRQTGMGMLRGQAAASFKIWISRRA